MRFLKRRSDPKAGTIGPYRILRKLGEGGMGEVYEAEDPRLGRSVAIKRILGDSRDPRANERLWREARAAALVSHPNVCQIYEIGETETGPFLVMELLAGRPLSALLSGGPLETTEAVRIAREVLTGLEAIHGRGLIHRDLKPSNVFLTPHGVKLLDFGLARSSKDSVGGASATAGLTQTGAVVGTPRYMAPEQLQGRPLDGRTDLFAVGSLLYEMLTGSPAFPGENPIQIFQAILHDPTPSLKRPVPSALVTVVRRSLAKRPEERYPTAHDMAEDLREIEAVLRGAPSGNHVPAATAMKRLIVLPFQVLRADPEIDYLSFSLADAITSALSGIQSLLVRSSLTAARYANQIDLGRIAQEAEVDFVLSGTLLKAGDQIRVNTQLTEVPSGSLAWSHVAQASVHDIFQLEEDLKKRIVNSLSIPLSEKEQKLLSHDVPANAEAYEYYLRAGQQGEGPSQWRIARDLCLRAVQADPNYAPAWVRLGRSHLVLGKYTDEGPAGIRKAEEALRRALSLNPDLPMAHYLHAKIATNTGRALEGLRHLLTHSAMHRTDPEYYAALNLLLRFGGLLEPSLEAHHKARALDPKVPTSVPYTLYFLGRYEEAYRESAHEPAFQALLLHLMGRSDEGLYLIERLERLEERNKNHFTLSVASLVAMAKGDASGLDHALQLAREFPDPEGRFEMALWLSGLGRIDRAVEIVEGAVKEDFYVLASMQSHPWLTGIQQHSQYPQILAVAEEGRRRAAQIYRELGGEAFLGVPAPY